MNEPKCDWNWRNDSTGIGVSTGPRAARPAKPATSVRRGRGSVAVASCHSM
jgi:hypothetical protein